MTKTYSIIDFQPYVGQDFEVTAESGETRIVKLAAVREQNSSEEFHQFTVIFEAPLNTFTGQGLVTLRSEGFGVMENIFLVAITPKDAATGRYEAVFSVAKETNDV